MKIKKLRLIDESFLKAPKNYIIQSLLAVVVVATILSFVEAVTHAAIVAALGSSVFIVFAMPNTIAAEPRRIIGGHITGLISCVLCYSLFFSTSLAEIFNITGPWHWIPAALSVGLSLFLMAIFNFEHPPAASTALGIVAHEWSYRTIIFIVLFAISLAAIKILLKRYLKDLYT